MGPLEDALSEQRRRSEAMTAALRHARYAPSGDDPADDAPPEDRGDDAVDPPA